MTIQHSIIDLFELDPEQVITTNEADQMAKIREVLICRINELIQRDFEKLKWILYRIDINEHKLTQTLKNAETDAATVMADMIIARQIEKEESRKKFSAGHEDWSFDL